MPAVAMSIAHTAVAMQTAAMVEAAAIERDDVAGKPNAVPPRLSFSETHVA